MVHLDGSLAHLGCNYSYLMSVLFDVLETMFNDWVLGVRLRVIV